MLVVYHKNSNLQTEKFLPHLRSRGSTLNSVQLNGSVINPLLKKYS
jgi:hypothetical protein